MSNEMTDELRALDLIYHEIGDTKEARDAYEFLAARLRDEAAPENVAEDSYHFMADLLAPHVTDTHGGLPGSVVESFQMLLEHWNRTHTAQGAEREVSNAALSTQPAPSEQVAASVPCAFRSLLAEARRKYQDSDAAGDVLAWLDERVLETDYAAPVVTDAMAETVGSALFKYWNDVNEECRGKYRERVRAALEQALKGT